MKTSITRLFGIPGDRTKSELLSGPPEIPAGVCQNPFSLRKRPGDGDQFLQIRML